MSENNAGQRRIALVASLLVAGAALAFVSFGNIGENLVYYWNPTQLVEAGDKSIGATIRLGGVVKGGTVDWQPDDEALAFVVSDGTEEVSVECSGAPPQMFRDGIGVIVEGRLDEEGTFQTGRVLVKHSNEYRVPEEHEDMTDVAKTLEDAS